MPQDNQKPRDTARKKTAKPWESSFAQTKSSPKTSSAPLSRMAQNHRTVTPPKAPKKFPTKIVAAIAIILGLGVCGLYSVAKMTGSSEKTASSSSAVTTSSQVASARTSSKKTALAKAKTSATTSSSAKSSAKESTSSSSSSEVVSSSSALSSSSSTSTSSSTSSSTTSTASSTSKTTEYAYVVAGQGIYRTAVNHGLTVEEFLALNPSLSYSSTLKPGQKVRVK